MQDFTKEYNIEYQSHIKPGYGDVFPSFKDFLEGARRGAIIEIDRNQDRTIENRSHTENMEDLFSLIKTYRSYPKYRNRKTLEDLEAKIKGKGEMSMPIVLMFNKPWRKHLRILGGNTRLDIAFWYAERVPVFVIPVPIKAKGKR
jgi:hypothetical protein